MSSERKLPITALCLALAAVFFAFCWNLGDPFLSDDYILVSRASTNTPSVSWYFKNPGGDGSFRPIGFLYFSVVSHFGGTEPWKWHICGLMLHLLNCALLYLLTWRLWRNLTISLGSLLLFGLRGTRPEVVVWTAGSFDSLACFFVLLTLCWVFQPASEQRWFVSLVVISGHRRVGGVGDMEQGKWIRSAIHAGWIRIRSEKTGATGDSSLIFVGSAGLRGTVDTSIHSFWRSWGLRESADRPVSHIFLEYFERRESFAAPPLGSFDVPGRLGCRR
jgi:hypothetical protein